MDRDTSRTLLEQHHSFPSDHPFHVIVRASAPDPDEVLDAIATFCGLPHLDGRVVRVPSREGRWVSLRLRLPCTSADAVLDIYAYLATMPKVVRYL